jgi:hypothetical protein
MEAQSSAKPDNSRGNQDMMVFDTAGISLPPPDLCKDKSGRKRGDEENLYVCFLVREKMRTIVIGARQSFCQNAHD